MACNCCKGTHTLQYGQDSLDMRGLVREDIMIESGRSTRRSAGVTPKLDVNDSEDRVASHDGKEFVSNLPVTRVSGHQEVPRLQFSSPASNASTCNFQSRPGAIESVSTPELNDGGFESVLKRRSSNLSTTFETRRISGHNNMNTPSRPDGEYGSSKNSSLSSQLRTRAAMSSDAKPARSQGIQPTTLNCLDSVPKVQKINTHVSSSAAGHIREPFAKVFVVCCSCQHYHDMPSKLYECMTKPESIVEDKDLGVSGHIMTMVKCPWCSHGMSIACCAGYSAVIYLQEKLH